MEHAQLSSFLLFLSFTQFSVSLKIHHVVFAEQAGLWIGRRRGGGRFHSVLYQSQGVLTTVLGHEEERNSVGSAASLGFKDRKEQEVV